jgi:hypothetical protein
VPGIVTDLNPLVTADTAVTINGGVTLDETVGVELLGADLTFAGAIDGVDGDEVLEVTDPDATGAPSSLTFQGDVGTSTPLGSLTAFPAGSIDVAVAITANDLLWLGSDGGDLTVTATGSLTTTNGDILVDAADNLTIQAGATVSASDGIFIRADYFDIDTAEPATEGSQVQILGSLISNDGVLLETDDGNDVVTLDPQSTVDVQIETNGGDDAVTVQLGNLAGGVNVVAAAGDDSLTVTGTNAGEELRISTSSGGGADAVVLDPNGASPQFVLFDDDLETLTVDGAGGNDTFDARPDSATAIFLDGGPEDAIPPGDTLGFDSLGAMFNDTGSVFEMDPGPGLKDVTYTGFDSFGLVNADVVINGTGADEVVELFITDPAGPDGYYELYVNGSLDKTVSFISLQGFTFNADGGTDGLVGPTDMAGTWTLSGADEGHLQVAAGPSGSFQFNFTDVEDLSAGNRDDTVVFEDGASLSGALNDAGGTDTLDLSDYSTNLIVDLWANTVTDDMANPIIGTLAGVEGNSAFENAYGGAGDDLITGDNDDNVLGDGLGSDVINGGAGNDTFQLEPGAGTMPGPSADYLIDPSGNDTVDFSPASAGVTFDMDMVGFSQTTDLNFDVDPPETDAPQNVFGDASATVSLIAVGAAPFGQDLSSASPFENFSGSLGADTVFIDPVLATIRNVAGNDPGSGADPGDTLHFEADGNEVRDTGDSLTATGVGTVTYNTVETINLPNVAPWIIDNGDNGWSYEGRFGTVRNQGYEGDVHYRLRAGADDTARWTFNGVTPGTYLVSTTWTSGEGSDRDDAAKYMVFDGTEPLTVDTNLDPDPLIVNQQLEPGDAQAGLPNSAAYAVDGSVWRDLGTFTVTGNELVVELTGSGHMFLIADAVQIQRVTDGSLVRVVEGQTLIADGSGRVDFGTRTAGVDPPEQRTLTIQNPGTAAVNLTDWVLPAGYVAVGTLPAEVAGSSTVDVTLSLDPENDGDPLTETGSFSGELSFAYGTGGQTYNFRLSGSVTEEAELPPGPQETPVYVIDNADSGFTTSRFRLATNDSRFYLDDYHWISANSYGWARYTFTGLDPDAMYEVSTTYYAWPNRGTAVPHRISNDATNWQTVPVNQRMAPETLPGSFADADETTWVPIHTIETNDQGVVVVEMWAGSDGYAIADAMRLEQIDSAELAVFEVTTDAGGNEQLVEIFDGQSELKFGFTDQGNQLQKTIRIQNVGTQPMTFDPSSLVLPDGYSVFSSTFDLQSGSEELLAGAAEELVLQLNAAVPGSPEGVVSFENTDADENPFDFRVSGAVGQQIIDNDDAGFTTSRFRVATNDARFYLNDYRYDVPDGQGTATYTFDNLTPGETYQVAATWYAWPNRATDAAYTISGIIGSDLTVNVNQRVAPDDFNDSGAAWDELATVTLDPTSPDGTLTVTLAGSPTGYAIADAVLVRPVYLPEIDVQLLGDDGSQTLINVGDEVDFGQARQDSGYPENPAVGGKEFVLTNLGEFPMQVSNLGTTAANYFPIVDDDPDDAVHKFWDESANGGLGDWVTSATLGPQGSVSIFVAQDTSAVTAAGVVESTISLSTSDVDESDFRFRVSGSVVGNFQVVDDGDAAFSQGNFRRTPNDSRFYGGDYAWQFPNRGGVVTWSFPVDQAAMAKVSASWYARQNRATNVTYQVYLASATQTNLLTATVNQRLAPAGGPAAGFQTLVDLTSGANEFLVTPAAGGDTLVVKLMTTSATNGYTIADAIRIDLDPGSPLHAVEIGRGAEGEIGRGGEGEIGREGAILPSGFDLSSAVNEAANWWASAGATPAQLAQLGQVQASVTDLPGTYIGWASATRPQIWIDTDAAGHGWHYEVQSTKYDSNTPTLQHSTTPFFPGGMDLATVLAHELGHVIGHEDLDEATHATDLMSAELAPGERFEVGGETLGVRRQRLGVGGERFEVGGERFEVGGPATGDLRRGTGLDDLWSSLGDFGDSDLASRVTDPVSENLKSEIRNLKSPPVTDALFARLDDRAGAITDDYGLFTDEDDSSDESEDGLDLWSMLF